VPAVNADEHVSASQLLSMPIMRLHCAASSGVNSPKVAALPTPRLKLAVVSFIRNKPTLLLSASFIP
jgi:hypothetical protein